MTESEARICKWCDGDGACPGCWGQAAIDILTQRLAAVEEQLNACRVDRSYLMDQRTTLQAEKAAVEGERDRYRQLYEKEKEPR